MYLNIVKNYRKPTVLILDSGFGGLFIYKILQNIFPNIFYLYFFDNKFFPYGERSEAFIIHRVILIITTIFKQYQFDLVIIACNTISVVALKILRTQFTFPIVGIMPEIILSTKYTKNKIIGVLATPRTINNNNLLNLINFFSYQYTILLLGTSKLVRLAESKVYGNSIIQEELKDIFTPWLKLKQFPDTLVLGCTHFSLLKQELIEMLPVVKYIIDSEIYCKCYIVHYLSKYFKIKNIICKVPSHYYNMALCTMSIENIKHLKYILLRYNFISVEILSI